MKVTVELESDNEKQLASRFLGSDTTPQTINVTDSRFAVRLLQALRQFVIRESIQKKIEEEKNDA